MAIEMQIADGPAKELMKCQRHSGRAGNCSLKALWTSIRAEQALPSRAMRVELDRSAVNLWDVHGEGPGTSPVQSHAKPNQRAPVVRDGCHGAPRSRAARRRYTADGRGDDEGARLAERHDRSDVSSRGGFIRGAAPEHESNARHQAVSWTSKGRLTLVRKAEVATVLKGKGTGATAAALSVRRTRNRDQGAQGGA